MALEPDDDARMPSLVAWPARPIMRPDRADASVPRQCRYVGAAAVPRVCRQRGPALASRGRRTSGSTMIAFPPGSTPSRRARRAIRDGIG